MESSTSLSIGQLFSDIKAAKEAIKLSLAEAQESWKATYSDKTRFNIVYTDSQNCNF